VEAERVVYYTRRVMEQETQPNSAAQLVPSSQRPLPSVAELYNNWRTYCQLSAVITVFGDAPSDIRHWLSFVSAGVLNVKLR